MPVSYTHLDVYKRQTYNHNGDLYRVESFDEGYTEPKVTLRRIKDGTIFDVDCLLYTSSMRFQEGRIR